MVYGCILSMNSAAQARMNLAKQEVSYGISVCMQRWDAHTDSRTSSTVALSDASSTVQPFHVYTCSQVSLNGAWKILSMSSCMCMHGTVAQ